MRAARDIMGDLAATGMTPDQIALVMELSAAISAEARPVTDEAAARRRERDKEYQAQKRNERRQTSADSDDIADPPLSRPPNENNLTPPTHTPEYKTTRARGKHRMPADWNPKPLTGDTAKAVSGWPSGAIERELARFRDWAAGGGPNARKEDWDATWRNWLRRADDEGRYGAKPTTGQRNGPASTADAFERAMQLTGGAAGCGATGPPTGDDRIGAMPDPVRAIGHVQ